MGILASHKQIAQIAKTHWWTGTNEIRLAKAAHKFGCALRLHRVRRAEPARKLLEQQLRSGVPVLLCVDDWEHWLAVLGRTGANFVVIDSDADPILDVIPWTKLEKRWRYHDREYDEEDPPRLYDAFPVEPYNKRKVLRGDFRPQRVAYLRRRENALLANNWDTFIEDLRAVCRPNSSRFQQTISFAEFLRRHEEMLKKQLSYWHGDVNELALSRLFRHFQFVAETYGLIIPANTERRAIADLSMLVTLWASAQSPVEPFYNS